MAIPALIDHNGGLTADGQKLVNFIEAQFVEADAQNDMVALNGMAGVFKQYYVDVHKMGKGTGMTPERWVRDFQHSFARSAYQIMEAATQADAQAQTVTETAQQTGALTQELEALKTQFAEAKTLMEQQANEIRALKEAGAAPAAKPKKQAAATTTDDDADEGDE